MLTLYIVDQFGAAVRTVTGSAESTAAQVFPGESSVASAQISPEHYWTGTAWVARGPQPSLSHRYDWPSHTWIDPRTLTEHQDDKWAEIKAAREAAIDAPLATPHGTFDSGPADRSNITDAVLMAQTLASLGQPVSIEFTKSDNTAATLNAAQMVEVGLYLGARVQAAYATARTLREAIAAAAAIDQVQAIHWP